jgi:hypothetical protein
MRGGERTGVVRDPASADRARVLADRDALEAQGQEGRDGGHVDGGRRRGSAGKKVRECGDDKWKGSVFLTHFPPPSPFLSLAHTPLPPHGNPSTPQSKMVRLHSLACSSARAASL